MRASWLVPLAGCSLLILPAPVARCETVTPYATHSSSASAVETDLRWLPAATETRSADQARPLPPTRWDWREHGGVTPARSMGFCDATWCFAAVAAVEAMLLIQEGRETNLSEQQVLACATPDRGCRGGWMYEAYRFIRDHGVTSEACFPFSGDEGASCTAYACAPVAVIGDWLDIPCHETALKTAVRFGPVSTTMLVPEGFGSYDGSYCLGGAPALPLGIAVLIVGWDDALCDGRGGWICKNNVGPGWGDNGFFTVAYGAYEIGSHAQLPLPSRGDAPTARIANLFDLGGDGDGWPDPGEAVMLSLAVRNGVLAPARHDLTVTVRLVGGPAAGPGAEYTLPALAPGAAGELHPPLSLEIARTAAPGDSIRIELRIAEAGAPLVTRKLALAVGETTVLIVDDDEGEFVEPWFVQAVANAGYAAEMWDESRRGRPSAARMGRYRAVVYLTGVQGRLERENFFPLASFLQGGGRLLLSGQDIGWQLVERGDWYSRQFYSQYLEAEYLSDDSGYRQVAGVPHDPVGDGIAFTLGGPGGSARQEYPSLIAPLGGATAAFAYAPGQTAALRSTTWGRLVYCAFGIEAIDQEAARDSVMARSLRWLAGPPPDREPPQVVLLVPQGGEVYPAGSMQTVRWRSRDDRGVLYHVIERSFDGGSTWPQRLGFAAAADSELVWSVGDSSGTGQRVRVSATDHAGLWGEAASGAFGVVSTSAVADRFPPLLLLGNSPNPFNGATEIRLQLPRPAEEVTVRLFDPRGRLVHAERRGPLAAGPATLSLPGADGQGRPLPSGVYAYTVSVPGATVTGRLVIVR